jgi:hypothetical protein
MATIILVPIYGTVFSIFEYPYFENSVYIQILVWERSTPCFRRATPWAPQLITPTYHAWTDGSFRKSAGLGWIITEDDMGKGPAIAQGSKTLGDKQTAFDAELTAVEAALLWYEGNYTTHPHLISLDLNTAEQGPDSERPNQFRRS